jgi:hypothetical protein
LGGGEVSKKAERLVSYMDRANKHSTKPFKKGDNAHLAARRYDVEYSAERVAERKRKREDLRTRRQQLREIKIVGQARLRELKRRAKEKLPYSAYQELQVERQEMVEELLRVDVELRAIREELGACSDWPTGSFNEMFHSVAKEVLPRDVYEEIREGVFRAFEDTGT